MDAKRLEQLASEATDAIFYGGDYDLDSACHRILSALRSAVAEAADFVQERGAPNAAAALRQSLAVQPSEPKEAK